MLPRGAIQATFTAQEVLVIGAGLYALQDPWRGEDERMDKLHEMGRMLLGSKGAGFDAELLGKKIGTLLDTAIFLLCPNPSLKGAEGPVES